VSYLKANAEFAIMHVGLTLSELQRYYTFSYTNLVLDHVFVFCISGLLSNRHVDELFVCWVLCVVTCEIK